MSIQYEMFQKPVPRNFIRFVGSDHEFDVSEVYRVMEELWGVDGYFEFVVIYNDELEKELYDLEVIKKSSRGGCFKGPKFQEFFDQLGL